MRPSINVYEHLEINSYRVCNFHRWSLIHLSTQEKERTRFEGNRPLRLSLSQLVFTTVSQSGRTNVVEKRLHTVRKENEKHHYNKAIKNLDRELDKTCWQFSQANKCVNVSLSLSLAWVEISNSILSSKWNVPNAMFLTDMQFALFVLLLWKKIIYFILVLDLNCFLNSW